MQNLDNSTYGGEHNMKILKLQSYSGVSAHPGVYSTDYCNSHYPALKLCTSSETHLWGTRAAQRGAINIWPSCLLWHRGCTSGSELPQKIMATFIGHFLWVNVHGKIKPQPEWQGMSLKKTINFVNKSGGFFETLLFVQEAGLIWPVWQIPCFYMRENSFEIFYLSLKLEKRKMVLWWLPKHKVCAVNLPATSAVLQNSSVPNHCTFLKLGAVVRHILQHHSKETVKYPETWRQ